ncbi:MAG: hypothetical protein JWQ09_839 [Segetibacter sp.]|nr:hypothetical protein [Segetibacter sp.]
MKKSVICLLLITLVSGSIKAQLASSKWKGVIKVDDTINVTFAFGKDTLTVVNLDENSILETMVYTATNSTFTLQKISGQSDCGNSTIGKYKYQIKGNALSMTLVEDACDDRSSVLDNLQLSKNTL